MKCWLHKDRKCNKNCSAYLVMETIGINTDAVNGIRWWWDKEETMATPIYCALIYSMLTISEISKKEVN